MTFEHALVGLAPRVRDTYREALSSEILSASHLAGKPLRLAHFLAQVCHETGGLTILIENLNYTTSRRLMEVWPSRFRTVVSTLPYLRNPRALANKVYGGRMGNVDPDDGWKYIGRGLLQITGREHYARNGQVLCIPLENDPSLAIDPKHALAVALETWRWKNCDVSADADDVVGVTRKINGGLIGLADRRRWLERTKSMEFTL